jgi:hypothetical protein
MSGPRAGASLLEDPDAVFFCDREGPKEVRRTGERARRILDALQEA